MAWNERILFHRMKRNDIIISTGEITHQESMDSLTSTASFSPSGRPTLVDGDEVLVEWVDLESGISRYQFAGTLIATDTESHPAATLVPCQGVLAPLANARKIADGDLLLTGMTDGEVVETILTYCGISYDPTDIHEAGYVLGGLANPLDDEDPANIWWRAGEAGSTVVQEMNEVFFFKLLDIGNGRVVRLHYDPAPNGTGAYKTYTRGVSRDLFSVHRLLGQSTEITNTFRVNGLSRPCGPDNACICDIWATAFDANPHLGGRSGRGVARTVRPEDQHDIIQDVGLAAWRVRQLMRRNNRLPDILTLTALNDTNVHPCSVIGLVDPTTYIDANPRYYTVTTVDRSGHLMTISAIGGAPGDEGSIDSGVAKLCNKSEGTDSAPGDEPDLGFDFPPLEDGFSFDDLFGDDEWGEEVPDDELDSIHPFTNCTELDGMFGGVDWAFGEGYTSITNIDDGMWRNVGGASISYHLSGFGIPTEYTIDEIVFFGGGNATMALNETTPYASKALANDFSLGVGPVFNFDCEVWFGSTNRIMEISFGAGGVTLYATPGLSYAAVGMGTVRVTARLDTERELAYLAGNADEHTCNHPSVKKNNGGIRLGDGFPINQWIPISITFDYSAWPMHTYLAGQDGGFIVDTDDCSPFGTFPPEPCDHSSHRLEVRVLTSVGSTVDSPSAKIRTAVFGHTTCEINPNFNPGTLPDYEGPPEEEIPEDE